MYQHFKISFVSLLFVLMGMVVAGCTSAAPDATSSRSGLTRASSQSETARHGPEIYIFGGGYGVFSTGLAGLADQLSRNGVQPKRLSYAAWRTAEREILANRSKSGRRPIILIGHSLGANSTIELAEALKKQGIQVDFIASFAATTQLAVPSNVRNVTNYYFKSGGWGGIFVEGDGFRGNLDNRDVSVMPGVDHFNIDDNQDLRDEVVRSVVRHASSGRTYRPRQGTTR